MFIGLGLLLLLAAPFGDHDSPGDPLATERAGWLADEYRRAFNQLRRPAVRTGQVLLAIGVVLAFVAILT